MIHVANALSLLDPGNPDPNHPAWDTLLALRNTYTAPITARIHLHKDDGSVVMWPHFNNDGFDPYCDVIIQPNRMWAATFIPGNGFTAAESASAGAPQNWQGQMDIECLAGGFNLDSNVLVFFLLAEMGWKYGVGVPYLKDYAPPPLTSKALWRMAYAIPYFDDTQGDTGKLWSTGMAIANKSSSPVPILLIYTIGQNYPQSGQQYNISVTVPANGVARFDLLRGNSGQNIAGLSANGYPAGLDSEGHVDMTSPESSLLEVSSIIAPISYAEFMVEQAEAY
jgi:hypothetical protein